MTDGLLGPAEWDDADRISIGDGAIVLIKEHGGYVFLGVDCGELGRPLSVNLFFAVEEGNVLQMHTSAQIGERLLVPGEEDPPWIWGFSPDWYANEARWDQVMAQSLMEAGQTRDEAFREALFHHDGFEFQLRRSKFPGAEWMMRIEVHSSPDYDSPLVYPAGTSRMNTDGWVTLTLSPDPGLPSN